MKRLLSNTVLKNGSKVYLKQYIISNPLNYGLCFSSSFSTQQRNDAANVQDLNTGFNIRRRYSLIHDTNYMCLAEHETAKNEEALFELFKNKDTGALHMGTFLSALRSTGLRKSDPRLKEMMDNLKQVQRKNADGFSVDNFNKFV